MYSPTTPGKSCLFDQTKPLHTRLKLSKGASLRDGSFIDEKIDLTERSHGLSGVRLDKSFEKRNGSSDLLFSQEA